MNCIAIKTAAIALAFVACASLSAQISHAHLSTIQSANQAGEIVAYDAASGRYFVTNPVSNKLDVFTAAANGSLSYVSSIALVGAPNSVAVHNGLVAVAVEAAIKQNPGIVQFFDAATGVPNGASVTVGAVPDMVVFTPNGQFVLTADEGEADEATGLINPEGTVSIVDVAARTAATASFAPWNGQKAQLQVAGVRLSDVNNITLAQDVEPEYVSINAAGTTAFVTLQENNAIAEIDIATATVTAILPLGEKDHSLPGNELDASNTDGIDGNFQNYPILGLYMPDALATFVVGGVEYIATANEGDDRSDFAGFSDTTRGAGLETYFSLDTEDLTPETSLYTSAQLNTDAVLGRLKFVTGAYDIARGDTDGDGDVDQLYSFGARSFTIWTTAGVKVFDSGSQIEREMLARGLWEEGRSDDRGPEPESVVFGIVNGTPLLFVGLERTNAIMVYDVTNPSAPVLADVVDVAGESGISASAPEGLHFIDANDNPTGKALLAVASEGDGALSLFAIEYGMATATIVGVGCPNAQPVTLTSNLPQLGTSWMLNAGAIEPGSSVCLFWFGNNVINPGVDLSVIGAPGCFGYTDGNLGAYSAPVTAGSSTFSVAVPNNLALIGFALTAQVSAASSTTPANFTTSNGVTGTIGN
jgi:DNA-binding beta-propeller fold protein YncE